MREIACENAMNEPGNCSECEFFTPFLSLEGELAEAGWCMRAQFVDDDAPFSGRRTVDADGTCDDFSRCWWISDKEGF